MKVGRLFSLKLRAVINRINVAVKLRNLKGKSDRNVFVIFLNTKKFSTFGKRSLDRISVDQN
jgi:hypothetical protein